MASSPKSNFCSRTRALNALLAILTSAKAKFTSNDRSSPCLSAPVFGYAANRVSRVTVGCVAGINFLLLPGQHGIKSQRRPGEDPIAIFSGQHRQSRLGNLEEFREPSFRCRIVRSPRDPGGPEFRYE